eukprot:CAMPEP_0170482778 /NCGR_PEP_ID=MMETSP0208-20121228/2644_1 /TAXON_ID=197538 /ORGANISM="Strombidium inclinatum, Strain S3" /LENGTH=155 /DNA_ID=CAMNT_0010755649 /DNA_START=1172 /DNA_END=1635 /DNA_ORIENTATION=-
MTDIEQLKKHSFFRGINFSTLKYKRIPFDADFPTEELSSNTLMPLDDFMGESMTTKNLKSTLAVPSKGEIVIKGLLKKTRKYFMQRERYITVTNNGELRYYRNKVEYRGTLWLCKRCVCVKVARDSFEIRTPEKTLVLSSAEDPNSPHVDEWVAA